MERMREGCRQKERNRHGRGRDEMTTKLSLFGSHSLFLRYWQVRYRRPTLTAYHSLLQMKLLLYRLDVLIVDICC